MQFLHVHPPTYKMQSKSSGTRPIEMNELLCIFIYDLTFLVSKYYVNT